MSRGGWSKEAKYGLLRSTCAPDYGMVVKMKK
jgi:hypothetical protein